MKSLILLLAGLTFSALLLGQNSINLIIKDNENQEPLEGATVLLMGTVNGSAANKEGFVQINNIPDGKQTILTSFVGYEDRTDTFYFPFKQEHAIEIFLSSEEEEMEEIFVTATRSSRTIENVPTRIEAISGEELEEKGNMKPGDIRMLLNESTGIQTQQTSATSYNSSIRIQGLDGKYTQILRDGYPLYSGFSGGLGLLQVVPLDLKQVEVIKGASSTLYGGGAIAGLVDLVTKTPQENRELNFLLNGTSAMGMDFSGFYAQKFNRLGTTVFASYNSGTAYDPSDIGLTAIPKFNRITLNPKLFIYLSRKTVVGLGTNLTTEDRTGGDIKYIQGKGDGEHSYYEKNSTNRFSTQLGLTHSGNDSADFNIKNSLSYYDRKIEIPGFIFSGVQLSSFSEVSYALKKRKYEWILGLNLWTEQFDQDVKDTSMAVDYNHITLGAFIQNTWNISEKTTMEAGVRGDHQNEYGFFLLPRISVLYKINTSIAARLGGGLGYKTPTVFTEDAERMQFRNVLPIEVSNTEAERSVGGNLDVNYRTQLNEKITFSINILLFYTRITNPLILTGPIDGYYAFRQPDGSIYTRGVETNIKLTYSDFKIFIGYTLADVNRQYNGNSSAFPLVAKHRLNNVFMYELHEKLKVGLEAYYYSSQKLNDGSTGRSYWIFGLMVEKLWEYFSVFINFENISDTRQTKFDTIYTGTITNPIFRDIYAPVDGFVINGGIKIRL